MIPRVDVLLRVIFRDAVALLDCALKMLTTTIDLFEFIVGQLPPFLFYLSLNLLPVSFNPVPVHLCLPFFRRLSSYPADQQVSLI